MITDDISLGVLELLRNAYIKRYVSWGRGRQRVRLKSLSHLQSLQSRLECDVSIPGCGICDWLSREDDTAQGVAEAACFAQCGARHSSPC